MDDVRTWRQSSSGARKTDGSRVYLETEQDGTLAASPHCEKGVLRNHVVGDTRGDGIAFPHNSGTSDRGRDACRQLPTCQVRPPCR